VAPLVKPNGCGAVLVFCRRQGLRARPTPLPCVVRRTVALIIAPPHASGDLHREIGMVKQWLPWQDSVVLSGDVMVCRFVVTGLEIEEEQMLLHRLISREDQELSFELRKLTQRVLGPEFEITSLSFRRGSIEIFAAVGATYYVISRYKNFIESLDLACSQMRRLLQQFFARSAPGQFTVTGSWSPGAALTIAESRASKSSSGLYGAEILLWYFLVSHALLTGVVVWQLFASQ